MNCPNIPLEEVLDALLMEEPTPTYTALERWSERYPEHRKALADFFAAWAVQAELPQETEVDERRLVNLGVSHALDLLERRQTAAESDSQFQEATSRLLASARACGLSDVQLAAHSGLDITILQKLDLRRIVGDIPRAVFERIARALKTSPENIRKMILGKPLLAVGTRHKAKGRPSAVTQDFESAVRASLLSEEDKGLWLAALKAERESGGR